LSFFEPFWVFLSRFELFLAVLSFFEPFRAFLSFIEPGNGQFFWLWLKKGLKKSSKKLKTAQKSSKRLKKLWASLSFFEPKKRAFWASLSLKKGFLSFFEPEKGLFELLWAWKRAQKKLKLAPWALAQKSSNKLKDHKKPWALAQRSSKFF
jgi:hypothetical protein